ncbi:MAG: acyltransferase [Prevotella sp.]|nr:acyltransferase [Prevotella sp.]
MKELLTRKECTAMRGIAILAIMLHNYTHWLKGIVRENEYTWQYEKWDQLWQVVQHPDELLPMHLLSFFGHYGVPVFLFLSGYGLVKKYEQGDLPEVGIWRFIRYSYLKLFRIFIVGFVAFILLDAITPNMHRYLWTEVVAMLGMFANFFENPSKVVWPGPYWYFSITLQMYILYRLVFYRWRHWGVVAICIVVFGAWQVCVENDMVALERLRYNFVGGMLPFGIGLLQARYEQGVAKDWKVPTGKHQLFIWLLSLLVAVAGIFYASTDFVCWLFVPALIIWGTIALVKLTPQKLSPYIVWLGGISAAIFVVHPIVRKVFVRPYYQQDQYAGLLLYVVATVFLSWLFMKLIHKIPSPKL